MSEFKFYGVKIDQRYLRFDAVMGRLRHSPGFIGINPGEDDATLIFETKEHADEFFSWRKLAHVPTLLAGYITVPYKDIPKSRRRRLKKYLVTEGSK